MRNRRAVNKAFKELTVGLDEFCAVTLNMLQLLGKKEMLQEEKDKVAVQLFQKFHHTVKGAVSEYMRMADLAAATATVLDIAEEAGEVVAPTEEQLRDLLLEAGRRPLLDLKEKFTMTEGIIHGKVMVGEENVN